MDKRIAELESILSYLTTAHERLLALLGQKRQALRTADQDRIARCSTQENAVVQEIGELEKQRLLLVGELTLAVDPGAKGPMLLGELAERLDEPGRGRLLVLRQKLKQRVEQAQKETAVIKRTTESLVRHMQGLVQTIGCVMAGVGLYNNQGTPPKSAMAVSTFNATG